MCVLREPYQRSVDLMKKSIVVIGVTVILISSLLVFWPKDQENQKEMNIRKPAVSGRFYPGSPEELKASVRSYLDQAPYLDLPGIHGLVVPHAGYIYSGPTAGYGYKQLSDCYDTVIIIGPTHYVPFRGASIPDYTHYETPLGLVKVSEIASNLKKVPPFTNVPEAHVQEHCLEVQLPFLQTVLTDFEVVPIVLGEVDPYEVATALSPYCGERTLVIASSDLSHYHPYADAVNRDRICTEAVPALNFDQAPLCEACGLEAMETLMYLAQMKGWQGKLLDYRNSGDTAGGKDQVVGYMAAAFYENALNEEEQTFLLTLARQTLEEYLKDGTTPQVDEASVPERLKEKRACFVTLNKEGMLRGCIGNLTPEDMLYKSVMENAINAALRDPRFPPVTYRELSGITIEISVLSIPERILYESPEDLLKKIEGKGVIISSGLNRATYLPQVWEQLPDPEEFISYLCSKAGLSPDFWQKGALEVYVYTAQVFEEK